MGHQDFQRQWSKFAEQQWGQHSRRGWEGSGPQGPWGAERSGRRGGQGGPGSQGGPPPWIAGLFGLAPTETPRGPRARRGDVRAAILDVLRSEPMNGYQIIGQITERSEGSWKPSPGSVYPTLAQLQDEGLVEAEETRGRRSFTLTADGTAYVAENEGELEAVWAPFDSSQREERSADSTGFGGLKPEIGQVMGAVWQIVSTGTETQRRQAIDVLVETRRTLYGILADGDSTDGVEEAEGREES